MREISIALRRLRQQPSFAAAAIITLSLGIAAPTALFAVVNATLLQPLPYRAYHDIYTVLRQAGLLAAQGAMLGLLLADGPATWPSARRAARTHPGRLLRS